MLKLENRRIRSALSALFVGSLVSVAGSALADDAEGPAPEAPSNVATPAPAETAAPAPEPAHETDVGAGYRTTSLRQETEEPNFQAETTRQTWPNVPLLATGATVFGVSYIPAVVGGALAKDAEDRKDLYIPVAGPFMMLTQGPEEERVYKALLITDGVVQGVGALMMLTSFFVPETKTKHWYLIGENDLRLAPTRVGYTAYGVGATGRF